MSDTPFFSVIMPMYNVRRYIKICVDSILAQTFQDFELIIVDDCSTDDSYKICSELYGDNEKVHLFRQEKNQGQGYARNVGLKHAKGEYIWFIDSDDAIIPTAMKKLHKIIQKAGGVDALHLKGWYTTTQDDDKPIDKKILKIHWESNESAGFLTEDIYQRLEDNWATRNRVFGAVVSTIHNRKYLYENEIEFPQKKCYVEDQVVNIAALCLAKKYLMVRDAVYIYRLRVTSSTGNTDISWGIESLQIFETELRKFLNKVSEFNNDRFLKEHTTGKTFEVVLRDHAQPLYNGVYIPPELDDEVYESLFKIFGENTAFVKYLFHGFNNLYKQINILARQNYLLEQEEKLLAQQ